jgi:hypothetical protein
MQYGKGDAGASKAGKRDARYPVRGDAKETKRPGQVTRDHFGA